MLFSTRGQNADIECPAARLARVGGSFNPRKRGGQEVQILLRHPLELLSGVAMLNDDLDQRLVGLVVALVGLAALAAAARLALLHHRLRAATLLSHLSLFFTFSDS